MILFYLHYTNLEQEEGDSLNCKSVIIFSILIFLSCFRALAESSSSKSNIWDAVTNEFSLNHEIDNPAVQKQLQWLVKHPEYLQKLSEKSKPYIYHILKEIKKRNMPGELALIPMIESEFDPFSSSNKGAAGLWQLMPETGSDLGLTKNWWIDGRRSIGPSTNAALNYLGYLHRFFHGNWILAVAAYDTGENRVARVVKRNHHSEFWKLPLSHETKAYIPKLLALSEVVQNPNRYHITLPEIPEEPYFKEVEISKTINLNKAAKLVKIPSEDLHRLNPGFKDWSKLPYQPYKLLIPKEKVSDFNRNLANLENNKKK